MSKPLFLDYTKLAKTRYTDLFKNDEVFDAIITTITEVMNDYQNETLKLYDMFSVGKAENYGLDFIGNIVKQTRLLADFYQGVHFGFKGSYKSGTFGTVSDPDVGAEWYSLLSVSQNGGRLLTDDEYRNVIRARIISNNTACNTNDFINIVRLLSFSEVNSIDWNQHGVIRINITEDKYGLLSYFISKIGTSENILPIPLGYRLEQQYI